MPLLTALMVDDGVWVPYASVLLIELYENTTISRQLPATDSWSVRLVYNGRVLSPAFCKNPGGLCRFTDLSDYLNTVTPPEDYGKLCSLWLCGLLLKFIFL